jgi:LAO/AO transport system kinase
VSPDPILEGDLRAISRAATRIENRHPEAEALLKELFPHTGRAELLGVTGPPGAGKSTFTSELVRELRREGRRVAVLAVDPTSPFTGGAILGDRIRMQAHHADPGVFIRSIATRGALGGLSAAALDLTLLFDAAGFDSIVIETVGVGQDEVDIAQLAHCVLVVLVPGMGDDVQAVKAGIMEIAQVFVINKADLPGAGKLESELRFLLSLAAPEIQPAIIQAVATAPSGIRESLEAARQYLMSHPPRLGAVQRWTTRLREMVRARLMARVPAADFETWAQAVAAREIDPYTAAARILHA